MLENKLNPKVLTQKVQSSPLLISTLKSIKPNNTFSFTKSNNNLMQKRLEIRRFFDQHKVNLPKKPPKLSIISKNQTNENPLFNLNDKSIIVNRYPKSYQNLFAKQRIRKINKSNTKTLSKISTSIGISRKVVKLYKTNLDASDAEDEDFIVTRSRYY